MGKVTKPTVEEHGKQSKISAFFKRGASENGPPKKSILFTSVDQQMKTEGRLTQKKDTSKSVSQQHISKVSAAPSSKPRPTVTKSVPSIASRCLERIINVPTSSDCSLSESVTCIGETQPVKTTPRQQESLGQSLLREVTGTQGDNMSDDGDADVIPVTPVVAPSRVKRRGALHRSFLTSCTSVGAASQHKPAHHATQSLQQKGKKRKVQAQTLDEALKSVENDLEFASPEMLAGIGLSFPESVSWEGQTPKAKRVLRKTPGKDPSLSCQSGGSSKKLACAAQSWRRNLMSPKRKVAQDSTEKTVHLNFDSDSDLSEILGQFSNNADNNANKTKVTLHGSKHSAACVSAVSASCGTQRHMKLRTAVTGEVNAGVYDRNGELAKTLTQSENMAEVLQTMSRSENVGELGQTLPQSENLGELGQTLPQSENLGELGQTSAQSENLGELGQTLPQSENLGELGQTSAQSENLGELGQTLPQSENLGELGQTLPQSENLGELGQTLPQSENLGELGQTSAQSENLGELGQTLPQSENLGELGQTLPQLKNIREPEYSLAQSVEDLDPELMKNFKQLSPFKTDQHKRVDGYSPETAVPACAHFGRYKVQDVDTLGPVVVLQLCAESGGASLKVQLEGFWADTHVEVGDIVHVIGDFGLEGSVTISDSSYLIIVNPDLLISGTSVVSGIHCMRRAVLAERFKGYDGKNIHMLYGTLIHSFFQQVVKERAFNKPAMEAIAGVILEQSKALHDMYALSVTEEAAREEIRSYIPQVLTWASRHIQMHNQVPLLTPGPTDVNITKLADIEENIWSPRFGVKGKIDLTVEVKVHDRQNRRKIVPLELKTGKPTYSIEHKGQVTLYAMMSCDRREDPGEGLLLYLKDASMRTIPADQANKRGLVQLRNELAHHLRNNLRMREGSELPAPINSHRTCVRCPQIINCAAYQRIIEKKTLPADHAMSTLEPETLHHLRLSHLEYYHQWVSLLMLELSTSGKRGSVVSDIWCKTAWQREQEGECLSGMVLSTRQDAHIQTDNGGGCLQTFTRVTGHPSVMRLCETGPAKGDSLVVSAENRPLIALTQGFVTTMTPTEVTLLLDRDLRAAPDYKSLVFRLDKADTFNTMGSNLANLTRFMENTDKRSRLRDIVIDRKAPRFEVKMSRGVLDKVKSVFKMLNKPQKTAILKVLMCNDYVLIKGYPGTGKTSTIVSLVRILNMLGRSLLLTSYTHSAVDNILLKLKKFDVDFVRLGRINRIHQGIHSHSAEMLTKNITTVKELAMFYESKRIVATTCLGVNSHPVFSQRTFDVCIVDEASQVLQPACLAPLFVSRKFVLVGDPQQLPPVVQNKEARARGMAESLFSRLDKAGGTCELNLQYRMNTEIMELSNRLVYGGCLRCGTEDIAQQRLTLPELYKVTLPAWLSTTLSDAQGMEVVFLDTDRISKSEDEDNQSQVKNKVEAGIVKKLVQVTIKAGLPPDDIGVITPYRGQVTLLKNLLNAEGLSQVEVNTVDQYQGRDKAFIIVSFVKQSQGKAAGILEDMSRLNVALTRARHKLVMVGSATCLVTLQPLKAILALLRPQQSITLPPDWETAA